MSKADIDAGAAMRAKSQMKTALHMLRPAPELHARVEVRMEGRRVETTAGRVLLREIVPGEIPF